MRITRLWVPLRSRKILDCTNKVVFNNRALMHLVLLILCPSWKIPRRSSYSPCRSVHSNSISLLSLFVRLDFFVAYHCVRATRSRDHTAQRPALRRCSFQSSCQMPSSRFRPRFQKPIYVGASDRVKCYHNFLRRCCYV